MRASRPDPADDLECLLAEALARFDEGGEAARATFVAAQTSHVTALERGIRRCREMGMLGPTEKRGLQAAQLPARGLEALEDRDDCREWRARVAARKRAK
jgi:hypothetical protein